MVEQFVKVPVATASRQNTDVGDDPAVVVAGGDDETDRLAILQATDRPPLLGAGVAGKFAVELGGGHVSGWHGPQVGSAVRVEGIFECAGQQVEQFTAVLGRTEGETVSVRRYDATGTPLQPEPFDEKSAAESLDHRGAVGDFGGRSGSPRHPAGR